MKNMKIMMMIVVLMMMMELRPINGVKVRQRKQKNYRKYVLQLIIFKNNP